MRDMIKIDAEKITDTHVFFYGGTFSQWCEVYFKENDITYNCCEQYMMAKKALEFNDKEAYKIIMSTNSPWVQKKIGRQVKNYNDDRWANVRFDHVVKANYLRFSQIEIDKAELLATENKIIVEASPTDKIWGIGLDVTDDRILDESKWQGQNLLGKALMKVRELLIEKEVNE